MTMHRLDAWLRRTGRLLQGSGLGPPAAPPLFRAMLWMLGALCLAAMAGSAPAAPPVDPRPDPNACRLLTDLDLEPLLFGGEGGVLDSWSNAPAPGEATCRWEARPRGRAPTATPSTATLTFYHLADRARAHQQLTAQPDDGDHRRSPALDGHGDDELVRSAPTVIVARHGADLAVLDARGAEIDDPAQPEARYLLDAMALKAAGATVAPPPWARPGQTAGWAPLPASAAASWTPPANPGAATSPWLAWPLRLLVLAMRHGFLLLFAGIFGPVLFGAAWARRRAGSRLPFLLAPVGVAALVGNLVFGDALADRLLYRFGIAAPATITGTFGTSTQYNNHDVVGYHVLLRTPGGTVATSFEDDDFNVYPPHNATRYPGEGDVFTVRHLAGFPGTFAIVADDGSPWATALRCAGLRDAASRADRRAGFSQAAGDRDAASRAAAALRAASCPLDG